MRPILIAPLVVPLLTFVPAAIYTSNGGVLYAHGPSATLLLLGAVMSACVFVWECIAIPWVTLRARRNKRRLRASDIFCLFLATAYILVAVLYVVNNVTG